LQQAAYQAHDAYRDNEILMADPVELVRILYRAAIGAVSAARRHVRDGRVRERSVQITRAGEIINELLVSVDRERGGDIAAQLVELYDYMQRLLQDANFRQVEQPLAELEGLMRTLLEGWEQCRPAAAPEPRPAALPFQVEPPAAYSPAGYF
jgi:flagellar protein FliS